MEFTDDLKQEERAIRRILGTQEDIRYKQLHDIEEIYFVGTMTPASLKGVEVFADGIVKVNGPQVKQGSVSSLKLIGEMLKLRKLALIKQPIRDISNLSRLWRLQEVDLSLSEVDSLSGLSDLPSLQTLNLSYTKVKDLTPLRELPYLKTVIVTMDMLPMKLDPEAKYQVIIAPDKEEIGK